MVEDDDACSDEYENESEVDSRASVGVELVNDDCSEEVTCSVVKDDKSVEDEAACEVDDALVSVELRSLMVVLKYPE
jgi:hypothetical protein